MAYASALLSTTACMPVKTVQTALRCVLLVGGIRDGPEVNHIRERSLSCLRNERVVRRPSVIECDASDGQAGQGWAIRFRYTFCYKEHYSLEVFHTEASSSLWLPIHERGAQNGKERGTNRTTTFSHLCNDKQHVEGNWVLHCVHQGWRGSLSLSQ